jgi:hypothetical protein
MNDASSTRVRRSEARKHLRFQVNYRWSGQPHYRASYSDNISRHGLFLITTETEQIGMPVDLEVLLAGTKVRMRGVVAWNRAENLELPDDITTGFGVKLTIIQQEWDLLFV